MPFDMNDLRALKEHDETAWNRAYPVLWQVAEGSVARHMAAYFPEHVEDVAAKAIIKFQQKEIHNCNSLVESSPSSR